MGDNTIKFNLLSQVRLIFRVAFLRRKVTFNLKNGQVTSTSSIAVRVLPSSELIGQGAESELHPFAKLSTSRSLLVGTVQNVGKSLTFQGYFRSNLYFITFALLFFSWLVPTCLLLPFFTIGGLITVIEDPSTLLICCFIFFIIFLGVNHKRYVSEGILAQEAEFIKEHEESIAQPCARDGRGEQAAAPLSA